MDKFASDSVGTEILFKERIAFHGFVIVVSFLASYLVVSAMSELAFLPITTLFKLAPLLAHFGFVFRLVDFLFSVLILLIPRLLPNRFINVFFITISNLLVIKQCGVLVELVRLLPVGSFLYPVDDFPLDKKPFLCRKLDRGGFGLFVIFRLCVHIHGCV